MRESVHGEAEWHFEGLPHASVLAIAARSRLDFRNGLCLSLKEEGPGR